MLKWNVSCDVCGQFISFEDLLEGKAVRKLSEPDSLCSKEKYTTYCSSHTELKDD